jgi:hypothetical protein
VVTDKGTLCVADYRPHFYLHASSSQFPVNCIFSKPLSQAASDRTCQRDQVRNPVAPHHLMSTAL